MACMTAARRIATQNVQPACSPVLFLDGRPLPGSSSTALDGQRSTIGTGTGGATVLIRLPPPPSGGSSPLPGRGLSTTARASRILQFSVVTWRPAAPTSFPRRACKAMCVLQLGILPASPYAGIEQCVERDCELRWIVGPPQSHNPAQPLAHSSHALERV
jgi:hypothetical protein